MLTRRLMAAPAIACTLLTAAPAAAQSGQTAFVGPVDRPAETATRSLPDFRPPAGDPRRAGEPRRNGLIAAYPVNENLDIGIGRFRVLEMDAPRTHTEQQRNPASMRPRERGIAAVGFSLRF